MFKILVLTLLAAPFTSYAVTDIASVQACLELKYNNVKNYNSIVAAVVGVDESEILTFGNAKIDQLFEIGSITKTMTGTLLAKAMIEEKI